MRIAITTTGPGWDAEVDPRFGRTPGFAVVDLDAVEGALLYIENNQDTQAQQGAGIQATETMVRAGVGFVLTGHVGPKAFRALRAAGVEVFLGIYGTARQALDDYRNGALRRTESADVEGHG